VVLLVLAAFRLRHDSVRVTRLRLCTGSRNVALRPAFLRVSVSLGRGPARPGGPAISRAVTLADSVGAAASAAMIPAEGESAKSCSRPPGRAHSMQIRNHDGTVTVVTV
jgi:hypothetical protein